MKLCEPITHSWVIAEVVANGNVKVVLPHFKGRSTMYAARNVLSSAVDMVMLHGRRVARGNNSAMSFLHKLRFAPESQRTMIGLPRTEAEIFGSGDGRFE